MKHLVIILLFFLSISQVCGQRVVADSLISLLEKEDRPIHQIDLHFGICHAMNIVQEYDLAEKHLKIATDLSRKNNYSKGKTMALLFQCSLHKKEVLSAEEREQKATQALELAKSIPSNTLTFLAQVHLAKSFIYGRALTAEKKDLTTGIELLNEALKEVDSNVSNKHIGDAYRAFGSAHDFKRLDSLAIIYYQKALYHYERIKTHPFIDPELGRPSAIDAGEALINRGKVHIYLSDIYVERNDLEKASLHMMETKKLFNQTSIPKLKALAILNVAEIYSDLGVFEEAIVEFQNVLKIYEELGNIPKQTDILQQLGDISLEIEDFESAEKYLLKALNHVQSSTDTILIVDVYISMSILYTRKNELDKALDYLSTTEKINLAYGDSTMFGPINSKFARIWLKKMNFPKALGYQKMALKWGKAYDETNDVFNSYNQLGEIFLALGELDSALHYIHLADELTEEYQGYRERIDLMDLYSKVHAKKGNYEEALKFRNNYIEEYLTVMTENTRQKLKEEQVRQNVSQFKKEKEIAEREATFLTTRNRWYLMAAIALSGILLFVSFLFNQLRKVKQQLENQNTQLQQLNTTKDKFFGIIAHDIRSPIVALSSVGEQIEFYLKKNQPEKLARLATRVDQTSKQLSGLLDNLLNWALLQQGVIPYHPKSINVSEAGANIFQMFQNNAEAKNIKLISKIDPNLQIQADESAFYTIIRNLISNAIKFTGEGGTVSISTETRDEKVFIHINDTGTGISAEKLPELFSLKKDSLRGTAGEKGTGLGLSLVKDLLEMNKASIKVQSLLGKGSNFSLIFPVPA